MTLRSVVKAQPESERKVARLTYTPPADDTLTENFRAFTEQWAGIEFEPDRRSLQKWHRQRTESGATSPFLLFLTDLDFTSSFDTLLAYPKYGLAREDGEKLANRLAELKADLAEDDESPGISIPSVLGLIRFLCDNPQMRDPSLVASNTGNIRAEWHESWSQHFVIEFTSDTDARFVLFVEDVEAPGKKVRVSVTCSISSIMEQASPHGVREWAVRL